MKKIIIHWTAGSYFPNETDKAHYHYLIDRNGILYDGKFKPEDNLNCNDGNYAPHCGGGNTGSIGIAMCGMAGFVNKNNVGRYPLEKIQLEACFKLCAQLCKKYKIGIENVITHYEFGKANPKTTSSGKIDIIYLPPFSHVLQANVGAFIRSKVKWYLGRL